jgi:ubiquinone/menaquinone biosynthesis C-methylase UbiE
VEDGYEGIGVEINMNAIEYGKKTFHSLEKVKFYIGDGPDAQKNISAHSADLIYTSAVLRHIAPEKIDIVIAEFSRIRPKYIITLEDETSLSYRTFPHNYRSKFESNSWREVHKEYAIDFQSYIDIGGLGSMLRVYEKKS